MKITCITIDNIYGYSYTEYLRKSFPDSTFQVFHQSGIANSSDSIPPKETSKKENKRKDNLSLKIFYKFYECFHFKIFPFKLRRFLKYPNTKTVTNINDEKVILEIKDFTPDFILIYGGKILSAEIIKIPVKACINIHGGKLPEYRGSNCLKWTLLHGKIKDVMNSIHVANHEVDKGILLKEVKVKIYRFDRFRTIFTRLHKKSLESLKDVLNNFDEYLKKGTPITSEGNLYRIRQWDQFKEKSLDTMTRRAIKLTKAGSLEKRLLFQSYKRFFPVIKGIKKPLSPLPRLILFHHVAEKECDFVKNLGITMTKYHFEDQIKWLTENFKVVTYDYLLQNPYEPNTIVITIDDGYKSIKTEMLPILEKYNCPAKVYVMGSIFNQRLNWLNELSWLKTHMDKNQFDELAKNSLDTSLLSGKSQNFSLRDFIIAFNETKTISNVNQAFNSLYEGDLPDLFLSAEEMKYLINHPLISIGSHTYSHVPLNRLTTSVMEHEVLVNHTNLNVQFNNKIDGFSIPFGWSEIRNKMITDCIKPIDKNVVTAYGGFPTYHFSEGIPEIQRIGTWGDLGTLMFQMNYRVFPD